ncbi:LOW QUALITY PROTEIN: hypothetical protein Ct61P_04296 [Colletotrichum tofieldiae]|nr:LOW QUALITY PROTEIN: hypothetical protein Ct61P_04296 [Colletotrichum tofieldiae]
MLTYKPQDELSARGSTTEPCIGLPGQTIKPCNHCAVSGGYQKIRHVRCAEHERNVATAGGAMTDQAWKRRKCIQMYIKVQSDTAESNLAATDTLVMVMEQAGRLAYDFKGLPYATAVQELDSEPENGMNMGVLHPANFVEVGKEETRQDTWALCSDAIRPIFVDDYDEAEEDWRAQDEAGPMEFGKDREQPYLEYIYVWKIMGELQREVQRHFDAK